MPYLDSLGGKCIFHSLYLPDGPGGEESVVEERWSATVPGAGVETGHVESRAQNGSVAGKSNCHLQCRIIRGFNL